MILDLLSVLSSNPTFFWAQTNPCLCFVISQYLVKSVIIVFSKEFFTIFSAWSFLQPYCMLLSHKSAFFLEILNIDSNMLCRSILSLASFLHNKLEINFVFSFSYQHWHDVQEAKLRWEISVGQRSWQYMGQLGYCIALGNHFM